MKSLFASLLILGLSLNSFAQKFKERYMYRYDGEKSLNLALISKELYNKKGKVVFAEYFDYFNDVITDKSFQKGKYYYTYNDTLLIKELYAGYAYQFDVWGNSEKLDTSNFADSSIIEYTYKYDSLNRIITMDYYDQEKSANQLCAFGSNTEKDTVLFNTEEWYRNMLIDKMNIANEHQKNKSWTQRRTTTYNYKYDDDEQEPKSIESVANGKVYAYRRFKYNRDDNNTLVSKTWEDYNNQIVANQMTLSSITHTRYKNNCYMTNRVYIYNIDKVSFTDTTATFKSKSATYYLDNKKRIIQIHNKDDMQGDIFIHRRKDGNFTKIVIVDNNIPGSDKKHKITLLFKYK